MSKGASRDSDPWTAKDAARKIETTGIKLGILAALTKQAPLNGWEMSLALELPTICVVPRLAPMRTSGWIEPLGTRPGPSGRSQIAYIITALGQKVLTGTAPKVLATGQMELL